MRVRRFRRMEKIYLFIMGVKAILMLQIVILKSSSCSLKNKGSKRCFDREKVPWMAFEEPLFLCSLF